MADTTSATDAAPAVAARGELPPMDTSKSQLRYVNFCHVTTTSEDVTIDLGMQTAEGAATGTWESPQRITLNFLTVKRLVQTLGLTLRQYEATFGTIETNVEKRLVRPVE